MKLHVGKSNGFCLTLKVHGTNMPEVSEETYLGDILSSDGKNSKNIKSRISKGVGIISQLMNLLDEVSFGPYLFEIAMMLRESMLINGVTTNAEIWYNFSESDSQEFENLDKLFFRRLLKVPQSTPTEAFYLEMGAVPIGIIIKARRLNYLHSILRGDRSGMLYSFLLTQWHNPSKGDWSELVKDNLEEFGIPADFKLIRKMSKEAFKKSVKVKSKELAFRNLLSKKVKHSKMANVAYDELKIQKYMLRDDIKVEQKRLIFKHRTRMAEYGENFRGGKDQVFCPFCKLHLDSQERSFSCPVISADVEIVGSIQNIYSDDIKLETVETIKNITEYRKKRKDENK